MLTCFPFTFHLLKKGFKRFTRVPLDSRTNRGDFVSYSVCGGKKANALGQFYPRRVLLMPEFGMEERLTCVSVMKEEMRDEEQKNPTAYY